MWDRLLANEWFVRLLSVALAVLIYLQVTGQGTGSTLVRTIPNVAVQVVGLSSNLWEDSLVPQSVEVTVSGARQTVLDLNLDLITATVNLSGATPGPNHYLVSVSIPSGLQLRSVTPATVTVVTEATAAAQQTVQVVTAGTAAPGYAVVGTTSTPNAVVVTGPSSAIADVSRVVATMNSAGASVPVQATATLQALNAAGQVVPNVHVTPSQAEVSANIKLAYPTAVLPVQVVPQGQPANGYAVRSVTVSPSMVTAVGPQAVLAALRQLPVDIDVSGRHTTVTQTVTIVQPPGVVTLEPSSVTVTAVIGDVTTSSTSAASISKAPSAVAGG